MGACTGRGRGKALTAIESQGTRENELRNFFSEKLSFLLRAAQ